MECLSAAWPSGSEGRVEWFGSVAESVECLSAAWPSGSEGRVEWFGSVAESVGCLSAAWHLKTQNSNNPTLSLLR